MKKLLFVTLISVLALGLLVFTGCGGDSSGGSAKGEVDLLNLLPADASGAFSINFKTFAQMSLYDEFVKEAKKEKEEGELFESYQDFVTKTGIDPKKDFLGLAGALVGPVGMGKPKFVMVMNVNYDPAKLTALLQAEKEKFEEVEYNGLKVLKGKEAKDKDMAFCMMSGNLMVAGDAASVNKVIDLFKGKGKSILTNPKMKPYVEKFKSGLASFVMELPVMIKKEHDLNGMAKIDLSKAEAMVAEIDYAANTISGEISIICPNEAGNTAAAATINGLKGMAAMGGASFGELANNVNIVGDANKLGLTFKITDELIKKLQDEIKQKMGGAGAPPPMQ
ncbi:MAG: hypothetical protein GY765_36635 [bacterium]|nr:hypothetical protein [bacterium]